jgi:hypothetical protein
MGELGITPVRERVTCDDLERRFLKLRLSVGPMTYSLLE